LLKDKRMAKLSFTITVLYICALIILAVIFTTIAAGESKKSYGCAYNPQFWCYADWECSEEQGATTDAERFPAKDLILRTEGCYLDEIGDQIGTCNNEWPGLAP